MRGPDASAPPEAHELHLVDVLTTAGGRIRYDHPAIADWNPSIAEARHAAIWRLIQAGTVELVREGAEFYRLK
jgi:hypothetical protein